MRQVESCFLSVLVLASVSELVAQENPKAAYSVSVGEVTVTRHVRTDFFPRPDLMVRVRRQDAIVLRRVASLSQDLAEMNRKVKAASEIVPGDPLTVAQVERLTPLAAEMGDACKKLSASRCARCLPYDERAPCPQCAKCEELRFLRKRKSDSEVVPGDPLTPDP